MIVVGVDSSSVSAGCAVLINGEIAAQNFSNNGLTHSQTLLPLIDATFKSAGITAKDADLFAVTHGPGSFTGLRIGMSTVKGMAAAYGKPCVGVSTLEAAAFGVRSHKGIICAAMDARCNQVYNALFESNGNSIKRLCDDRAISIEQLESEINGFDCDVMLCGDGAALCQNRFVDFENICVPKENGNFVHGDSVALLGSFYSEKACDYEKLIPLYLRLPQAQRELKMRKDR